MGTEIERKFLIKGEHPKGNPSTILQAFLNTDPDRTVRIRVSGDSAWLTIKARGEGIARAEFEYPIPVEDARQLLHFAEGEPIEKTRHKIPESSGKLVWEIDVFHGANEGLVVAEVELESADDPFERPSWLGEEVTTDPKYTNASLARRPYSRWDEQSESRS